MIHSGLCTTVPWFMVVCALQFSWFIVGFLPHRHGTSSHVHPYAVQHLPSPSHSGCTTCREVSRRWSIQANTMGSTSTWLASSGELATPVPLPTLSTVGSTSAWLASSGELATPVPLPTLSTVGSTSTWLASSGELATPVPLPTLSTVGSTSAWLASSGDLGTPLPLPTLQHNRVYVYLARILRWVGHPSPSPCCSSHVVTQLLKCQCWSKWNVWLWDHRGVRTLWTWLLGTFLQTLPESVTPLKGHSLSLRNCPLMLSAPSER